MKDSNQPKTATIGGITLALSHADSTQPEWIGQSRNSETSFSVLACGIGKGPSIGSRITGMPGIGKTTLGMVAALHRKQPL